MVLANNKENLNMDGCLWYFGGISLFLKAVYFGHTNKKNTFFSGGGGGGGGAGGGSFFIPIQVYSYSLPTSSS